MTPTSRWLRPIQELLESEHTKYWAVPRDFPVNVVPSTNDQNRTGGNECLPLGVEDDFCLSPESQRHTGIQVWRDGIDPVGESATGWFLAASGLADDLIL